MTQNYFAIERNGECVDHVAMCDAQGKIMFEDVMDMSYDEIKSYDRIDEFVVAVMDATNMYFEDNKDDQAIITLIGSDDVFIWGILVGPGDEEGEIKYAFINWQQDEKHYRYVK